MPPEKSLYNKASNGIIKGTNNSSFLNFVLQKELMIIYGITADGLAESCKK